MDKRGETIRMRITEKGIYQDSEIGKLKKVILHSPGLEIEVVTPKTTKKVLYNDIVPYSVVAEEHKILKGLLSLYCTVYEFKELLSDILAVDDIRKEIVEVVSSIFGIKDRKADLLEYSPETLLDTLIGGMPDKKETLTSFLSDREFDLHPLPNLYFSRDSAMVFRDRVITGAMAHNVRRPESLLASYIFEFHNAFNKNSILYNGSVETDPNITIEGGDFLVLSPSTLLIGVSERTTSAAIDLIARKICNYYRENITVFAVLLPKERATIHLDMIFTLIDRDKAMIYEPYITGNKRLPVIRMDVTPEGTPKLTWERDLLSGLGRAGIELKGISCGGSDGRQRQREQWMSGTNFLALEPGKIIGYNYNKFTMEALNNAGFTIKEAGDFISGKEKIENYDKLAIGIPGVELARGGGGVRCMTMPVERESIRD